MGLNKAAPRRMVLKKIYPALGVLERHVERPGMADKDHRLMML